MPGTKRSTSFSSLPTILLSSTSTSPTFSKQKTTSDPLKRCKREDRDDSFHGNQGRKRRAPHRQGGRVEFGGVAHGFLDDGKKIRVSEGLGLVVLESCFFEENVELDEMMALYTWQNGFSQDFSPQFTAVTASKLWREREIT